MQIDFGKGDFRHLNPPIEEALPYFDNKVPVGMTLCVKFDKPIAGKGEPGSCHGYEVFLTRADVEKIIEAWQKREELQSALA